MKLDIGKLARLEKCLTTEEEKRYRRRFLRSDATQAIFGIILILLVAFLHLVYQYTGEVNLSPPIRPVILLISLAVIVLLRFVRAPD